MRTRSQPHRPDPQKSLVGFVVGEVFYAIDIGVVREIVNPLPVTPLPHTPPEVAGVADHRGEVVPVISLRVRFGLEPAEPTRSTKWILVDGGSSPIGLIVDAVTEVFGTAGAELRPTPAVGGSRDTRGIAGVTSHNGALTFVLDTDRFLEVLRALEAQGVIAGGKLVSRSDAESPEIARALTSLDPEERRRAVSELSEISLAVALPLVMRALGDEDWRVRKEATAAASAFLPEEALLDALVEALRTSEVGLCNAAVEVLGAAGAAATSHLTVALETLNADGRKLAVEALGRTRDCQALAPLERAVRDSDPNVRQTAAESIATLGSVAPEAVEKILLDLLADADPIVRLSALSGLDALGASIAWVRLAPLLDDPTLRPLALAAVARAGHAGAPAVLARALGASSGRTFDAALSAFALVPLDPLPEPALAALRAFSPGILDRLLNAARSDDEEHPERRRTALVVGASLGDQRLIDIAISGLGAPAMASAAQAALERLGPPAAAALVARLGNGLDGPDDDARTLWVDALARLAERGAEPGAILDALRTAAQGTAPRAAARALHALGSFGNASDLALAEKVFLVSEGGVAYAAEAALRGLAIRHSAAARALAAEAEGEAERARAAAVALGALAEARSLGEAEPRALRFLSLSATSQDAATRRTAVAALGRVGGSVAVEALLYALADEESEVRRTAARGLGRLAAVGDDPKLLGLVRASGDPDLLASAVRAAGDVLASDDRSWAPSAALDLPRATLSRSSDPPPASLPPASADRLVSALAGLCEDPSPEVAIAALDSLRRAPSDVPGRIEAMAHALEHPDVDVVKTALLKLAAVFAPDASNDSRTAFAVLPAGVWERLRSCLDHDLADLRLIATESICVIDPARGREALVERARVERDPEVLAAIDAALSAAQRQKKGGGPS